jgi:hypothetical protein
MTKARMEDRDGRSLFTRFRRWKARHVTSRILSTVSDSLTAVERTSVGPLTTDEMQEIVAAKFDEIMVLGMTVSETRDIFISMLLDAFNEHESPNPRTTTLLLFTVQEETVRRMT